MAAPETLEAAGPQHSRAAGAQSATVAEHATYTLPTGAYPILEANANSERVTHAVALLMLAYTTFYILWRWLFTLEGTAYWFSIPLAVAETYGLITAFFMTYTTWTLKRRVAPPAPRGLSADVFVTTYDEPLNVIRKTALAAREIRYPHSTYILDDGKRDEIRSLAEDLGVGYLRRPDNKHAKAGNLNHALANSTGDFILQLDADHVPQPHILDRLLGFFTDERVALAQSPQDFYNTDGFTYDVNETARRIWEDQQLFFRVIQPGKDARDAAFFVGSCAVLRRKAIQDVGGFATTTITEDIETSLLLHSKGWKSVFYGETLAYGLAPGSAAAFHVQHLRWGQGAMQALRRYQPLSMRGLTVAQRIGYFDSLTTYFSGFQRLIFYLAPSIFFLTGAFPVRADALQFFLIFAPYIALQFLAFKLLSRGHGSLLLADRYGMAKFFTHLMAVTAYFSKGALKFKVTPKGITDVPFRTYAPQLALAVLTALAVFWGVLAASFHLTTYTVPGWGNMAFYVNLVFAGWTFYSAMYIVDMSIRLKTQRQDHRYAETMPVEVKVLREGRSVRATLLAVTNDLNPTGVSFRTSEIVDDGAWVEMRLPLLTRPVDVKGRVVHRRTVASPHGEVYHHGVEFVALPWEVRDAIELHCAHYTTPLRRQRYVQAFSAVGDAMRWVRDPRRDKRESVGMPVDVELKDGTSWTPLGLGLWEDVSDTGARLLLGEALSLGDHIRARVRANGMQFDGDVVFVRTLETALGARFVIGLRRPRAHALPHVSPQPRGTPVNWNKFDRLLNRTRTDATVQAKDALPTAAAQGTGSAAGAGAAAASAAAGAAAAAGEAYATEALRPASSLREDNVQQVEVLRPKSVTSAEEDEPRDVHDVDDMDASAFVSGEGVTAEADTYASTDVHGEDERFEPEPLWAEDELAAQSDVVMSEAELAREHAELMRAQEAASEPELAGEAQTEQPEPLPRWMAGVEPTRAETPRAQPRYVDRRPDIAASHTAVPFAADIPLEIDAPQSSSPLLDTAAPLDRDDLLRQQDEMVAENQDAFAAEMPSHTTPLENIHHHEPETGAEEMMTEQLMQSQSANANSYGPPSETSMLTVWGGGARLDGKFEIDDSIEVRCELSGEVSVGGRIVIEEGGIVNATVRTVDAEVRGTFNGDLIATGTVHITETGRVTGNLQTEELIIARGGFFNGNVTRPEPETKDTRQRDPAPRAQHSASPVQRNGGTRGGTQQSSRRGTQDSVSARPEAHTDE